MSPSWIVLECLTGRGLLKWSILSTSHPIPRQIFPRPNPNPSPQLTDPRWRLIGKCTFARSNTPALQARLIFFHYIAATCFNVNNCTSPINGICQRTDQCRCHDGYIGMLCRALSFRDVRTLAYMDWMLSMHHVAARVTLRIRKKNVQINW